MTAKRRKKNTSVRRGRKKSFRTRLWNRIQRLFLFWGILIPGFVFVVYIGYLDYSVRHLFEGKRWSIPAHVYASPTELYVGAPLKADAFEDLLQQLRYRKDRRLSTEATYFRNLNRFKVWTRPFRFWDEEQPSRGIEIDFVGGEVKSLKDIDSGKSIAILRMDPVQIDSFYPSHNEDRILARLQEAPPMLIEALLATEDRNFYQHYGVSPKAILRAVIANLRAGGVVQGGSTITQQLVKNLYLNPSRSLWRKANEAMMAVILEFHYDKDEILEAYVNEVFLGQEGRRAIHGFGLASQFYFDRSLGDLELHHIALLAGLVKGASYYNPRRSPERATRRRNLVIDLMKELGHVTPEQATRAKKMPLEVSSRGRHTTTRFPAFMDVVRHQLRVEYREEDLTSEGLQILTTLELPVQKALETNAEKTLKALEKRPKVERLQVATVVTRREGGEIAALLGGRDARFNGLNRATDIQRMIGSLVKPAVYLTALDDPERYSVVTRIDDVAVELESGGKTWAPRNFDRKEHGPVELHRALAMSYNLSAVHVGLDVGIGRVVKTLRNLGIERKIRKYPSILLGAIELSPLEVTQMYQTLAADGFRTPLRSIRAVLANDGTPLRRYPLTVRQAVDPATVFLINTLLQEVMREGSGRSVYSLLSANYAVAGKTGTTNNLRDSWAAGFSGDYLAVVWLGRDDNRSIRLTGSSGALKLWSALMREVSRQPLVLVPPDSIEWVWIDSESGLRANEACSNAVEYPFISGYAPAAVSPCMKSPLEDFGSWYEELFRVGGED